jgi:hypothetical protein
MMQIVAQNRQCSSQPLCHRQTFNSLAKCPINVGVDAIGELSVFDVAEALRQWFARERFGFSLADF